MQTSSEILAWEWASIYFFIDFLDDLSSKKNMNFIFRSDWIFSFLPNVWKKLGAFSVFSPDEPLAEGRMEEDKSAILTAHQEMSRQYLNYIRGKGGEIQWGGGVQGYIWEEVMIAIQTKNCYPSESSFLFLQWKLKNIVPFHTFTMSIGRV